MKKEFKGFVCGVLTMAVIGIGAVSASGVWDNISVLKNDISVVVNGKNITADNFLYEDTTYLPLRAVSESLNQSVSYDENTNTAYIGERTDDKVQTQQITGKYIPTDEQQQYCKIFEDKYYIATEYLVEKYDLTNISSEPGYAKFDTETEEFIFYSVEGFELKRVYRGAVEGYIPYDTYVDEIEPLLQ